MVVRELMEGDDLDKIRIFITVIELAGNSAYGASLCTFATLVYGQPAD